MRAGSGTEIVNNVVRCRCGFLVYWFQVISIMIKDIKDTCQKRYEQYRPLTWMGVDEEVMERGASDTVAPKLSTV